MDANNVEILGNTPAIGVSGVSGTVQPGRIHYSTYGLIEGVTVHNNRITGGYYGLSMMRVMNSTVSQNTFANQARNIIQIVCEDNRIIKNVLNDAQSTAIHVAYGCGGAPNLTRFNSTSNITAARDTVGWSILENTIRNCLVEVQTSALPNVYGEHFRNDLHAARPLDS